MSAAKLPPLAQDSFRQLRARTRVLSSLCLALTEASEPARIWRRIVLSSQALLNVDGCTFYRVDGRQLVPAVVLSRSLGLVMGAEEGDKVNFAPLTLPLPEALTEHDSLAARAALTGKLINVSDITRERGYSASRTRVFDEQMKYETRSILTLPVCFRGQPASGVLQLINIKELDGSYSQFGEEQEAVARALAALLALSQRFA